MAYVLGFLYADGYIQINSRKSTYFCFCSADLEILEKIKFLIQSDHKIGVRMRSGMHPRWKDEYVLQIGSRKVCEELSCLGVIPNKSLVITFPQIKDQYLGDFVRGYFDGDGCVHLGHYWRKDRQKWKWQFVVNFTSGSRTFLIGLWKALEPYVEGGHICRKKGGFELVFSRKDAFALFNLMYNNVSAGMFLERKHKTFLKAYELLNAGVV